MKNNDPSKGQIREEWRSLLGKELSMPYMNELREFLAEETSKGKAIFPRGSEIFAALNATTPRDTKVVILGQDPYHGVGQAHGLSFSVKRGVRLPPSLKNIFKELRADLGVTEPNHGDLTNWAEQGVLLLNAILTVEESKPASHTAKGWEEFTDKIIGALSAQESPMVFLLWGAFAQTKAGMIASPPHLILRAPHPSPLSAHKGFWGCKHFSKANEFLRKHGREPIDWQIT